MLPTLIEGESKVLEKSYGILDWSTFVAEIAGPMQNGDTRESWLARAARRSRLSYRQIRALYYGEIKDPKTSIALGILSAAEKARAEASELASRFEATAGALNAKDSEFYSHDVLALISAARRLRGLDRA